MIPQVLHCVEDCPACGCPVEIPADCLGDETVCGHCSERFAVFGTDARWLSAADRETVESTGSELAFGQGLAANDDSRRTAVQWLTDADGRTWVYPPCNCSDLRPVVTNAHDDSAIANWGPPVLVVEHRDEVFARIAADLADAGSCVVRAETAGEAVRLSEAYQPYLVVANLDLRDQSGCLMAAKLRLIDPEIRIWLYLPKTTGYDRGMAQFLRVDELLAYGGNLRRLSEMIVSLISRRPIPAAAAQNPIDPVEFAAA